MTSSTKEVENSSQEEKSFFGIIVHSFFIIPFLIAVFCVLLFAAVNLLTSEKKTAYGYLEDVKTGGITKRWQGAFELSKILANPALYPKETRFSSELIKAFENATHDDNRVRQYLALAMGRTGRVEFVQPIVQGLKEEKEENLAALIYALGMLKTKESAPVLYQYIDHHNALVRSIAVVSLGNIGNLDSMNIIKKGLNDSEVNVQWGAAISLAQLGDKSGKAILFQLMNRKYLSQYPEVDLDEQNNLVLAAIENSARLNDQSLNEEIKKLSQSDPNMKIRSAALKILK